MSTESDALYVRKRHLRKELRERGIRRDFWAVIQEVAEGIGSVKELDAYLDQMEAHHSELL